MRIGIEAQRIFRRDKHGMDFVILEVLRELQVIDLTNEYFVFVAPGEDVCLESTERMHVITLRCPTYPLWEQWALPRAARRYKVDLLHCTSNTAPLFHAMPLVLTLHDIIFLEPRQHSSKSWYQEMGWHYRRLVVPRILPHCQRIITVSQFERERIVRALNLPAGKVTAIHNGYNTHFRSLQKRDSATLRRYIPTDDFLFFLGNTDPKKNAERVLQAYALYLKESVVKRPLLIADLKEGYIDDLLQRSGITHIKSHLWFPGYIANTDLVTIYNACFAFLYPSLRESFGIPLLEAMACGTPVITSNLSALPEIAGKDAILVDPYRPEEIAAKLLLLETDRQFYRTQQDYGLKRVSHFTWRRTAEQYLELYRQMLPPSADTDDSK